MGRTFLGDRVFKATRKNQIRDFGFVCIWGPLKQLSLQTVRERNLTNKLILWPFSLYSCSEALTIAHIIFILISLLQAVRPSPFLCQIQSNTFQYLYLESRADRSRINI